MKSQAIMTFQKGKKEYTRTFWYDPEKEEADQRAEKLAKKYNEIVLDCEVE